LKYDFEKKIPITYNSKLGKIIMKIDELTDIQLNIIAKHRPDWMSKHRPEWMGYNRPAWMGYNRPDWMADNIPDWMADNKPEWMSKHRPDWMAYNRPNWMRKHRPDWMDDTDFTIGEVPESIISLLLNFGNIDNHIQN
jgi:hypothetical protein